MREAVDCPGTIRDTREEWLEMAPQAALPALTSREQLLIEAWTLYAAKFALHLLSNATDLL